MIDLLRSLTGWKRVNRLTAQALLTEMSRAEDYQEDKSPTYRVNRHEGFKATMDDDRVVSRYFKIVRNSHEAPKVCLREDRWAGSYDYGFGRYPIFHRATLDLAKVDEIVN